MASSVFFWSGLGRSWSDPVCNYLHPSQSVERSPANFSRLLFSVLPPPRHPSPSAPPQAALRIVRPGIHPGGIGTKCVTTSSVLVNLTMPTLSPFLLAHSLSHLRVCCICIFISFIISTLFLILVSFFLYSLTTVPHPNQGGHDPPQSRKRLLRRRWRHC